MARYPARAADSLKRYINPAASEAQILRVGHAMVSAGTVKWRRSLLRHSGRAVRARDGTRGAHFLLHRNLDGLALRAYHPSPIHGSLALGYRARLILGQTFMGVILGAAVVPIALAVTWSRANRWGCIAGALLGFCAGVIVWLVTTATLNGGAINVAVRLWRLGVVGAHHRAGRRGGGVGGGGDRRRARILETSRG
jgi:hypothetical protein